jgi:hypothetical protein
MTVVRMSCWSSPRRHIPTAASQTTGGGGSWYEAKTPSSTDPHHRATIASGRIHGSALGHRRRGRAALPRTIATSDDAIE